MENIQNIQQMINKRADEKLKKEIKHLHNLLSNGEAYQLLKDTNLTFDRIGRDGLPSFRKISIAFLLSEDILGKEVFDNNIERYRLAESQEFISKVNSLSVDVDTLLDNQEQY